MTYFQHTNSKGVVYYLNAKTVTLRAGKKVKIYFFTINKRPATAVEALPDDMEIRENPRNGFLSIVRKGADIPAPADLADEEAEEED